MGGQKICMEKISKWQKFRAKAQIQNSKKNRKNK